MSGGMQRTEHADDGEDRERQSNLDPCIARESAKRILPRLVGRQREPLRQDKTVERGERQHHGEGG
jgi:hypothetical protein